MLPRPAARADLLNVGFLEEPLRRTLGDPNLRVTGAQAVGEGCIHAAARITTSAGELFAKWSRECAAEIFLREADGLRTLRAAGSGLVVPEVLCAQAPGAGGGPAFIVMEYLRAAPGGETNDEALGRGLAAVHRQGAADFGFEAASYCGPTRQDNARSSSWPEFYAEQRLRPLVSAAGLATAEQRLFDRLLQRLASLVAPDSPPALIHGDLWSGNVMPTAAGPALFDPASAYADRELEFGITTLFGGFSARFWSSYQEAWPLPLGWRDRNPLYQLYHLLNHALIFGGSYAAQAVAVARRFE